jgi:hypothetical protein
MTPLDKLSASASEFTACNNTKLFDILSIVSTIQDPIDW